jgi:Kef-type K+ transport system membrane component KefB
VAVTGGTGPDGAITTIGFAALYTVAMLAVVRPLLARRGRIPMWAVLLLSILSAWVAERIGIHAIFGGFLAGLVLPRDRQWRKTVHGRLDPVVTSLLLPVFFVVVGLSTRIDQLTGAAAWLLLAVVVVAVVGKFGGSALAARLAGERWSDALTLGVLMNTRGITEIVILSVGLQIGIISSTVFTVMVLMALVTTLMAAPLLRWTAGRRLGGAQVIDDGA